MTSKPLHNTNIITESFSGIVNRITFHNPETGWSILRVNPINNPIQHESVVVHQTKVFAGATMDFRGNWVNHPKFGRQFKAIEVIERKPATMAALEKYLGSGLIKGVGPKTAKKIVSHFGKSTLEVFEKNIQKLIEVEGIATKKITMIETAWIEHRSIRDVMIFLQSHGISTLFAVKIFKQYKEKAIKLVTKNPYRLANDIYGIGFISADKIALSIGLQPKSPQRIMAAIAHVLSAARDFGHCFLYKKQISKQVNELLSLDICANLSDFLALMESQGHIMVRNLGVGENSSKMCFYAKSLYYDELFIAKTTGPPFP